MRARSSARPTGQATTHRAVVVRTYVRACVMERSRQFVCGLVLLSVGGATCALRCAPCTSSRRTDACPPEVSQRIRRPHGSLFGGPPIVRQSVIPSGGSSVRPSVRPADLSEPERVILSFLVAGHRKARALVHSVIESFSVRSSRSATEPRLNCCSSAPRTVDSMSSSLAAMPIERRRRSAARREWKKLLINTINTPRGGRCEE